jgi:hypothetical protein
LRFQADVEYDLVLVLVIDDVDGAVTCLKILVALHLDGVDTDGYIKECAFALLVGGLFELADFELGLTVFVFFVIPDLVRVVPEETQASPLSQHSLDLLMVARALLRRERQLRLLVLLPRVRRKGSRVAIILAAINRS